MSARDLRTLRSPCPARPLPSAFAAPLAAAVLLVASSCPAGAAPGPAPSHAASPAPREVSPTSPVPVPPPPSAPYLPDPEEQAVRFAFGLFGGLALYSDNLDLGDNNRELGLSPKGGGVYGARLGVDIGLYALQVEGTFGTSTYFKGAELAHLASVRGTALVHFIFGPMRTFALVGGGVHMLTNNPDHLRSDVDWAVHMGLGLRWDLLERLGLRVEGRAIGSDGHAHGSMSLSWELLAGLSLRFPKVP